MTIVASDNFHRPDQTNWGISSSGIVWGTVGGPGSSAIVSNNGTLGNFNNYTVLALGSGTLEDILAEVSMQQGPSTLNEGGISWRIQDINNNYRIVTFDNSIFINKYIAGVRSDVANAFIGFSNTDQMLIKVEHIGSDLKAKCWKASGIEPDWQIEVTESSILSPGFYGLVSDLAGGSGTGALLYSDFTVDDTLTPPSTPSVFITGNHRAFSREVAV